MKRGEVWRHEPPDGKARPVVVLTRDEAIGGPNKLLVAPLTGSIRGIATEVEVGGEDGMPRSSAVSLDNTALVRKSALRERIAALGPQRMDEICRALAQATSCV